MTDMKPHIRKVEQYWLCTEDMKERHILRGALGITPCQSFYNFMFQKNLIKIKYGLGEKYLAKLEGI